MLASSFYFVSFTGSATTLCITRGMTNSYQTSAVTISSPQSLPGKDVLLIKPVPRTNVEKELEVDSANSDRFTEEGKCVAHFAESTPFPGHDPSHAVAHDLPEAAADQNKEVEFFKPDLAALEAARRLGLEIGSMVEIPLIDGQLPRYGVIRWIGFLPELQGKLVAGVELVSSMITAPYVSVPSCFLLDCFTHSGAHVTFTHFEAVNCAGACRLWLK